MKVIATEGEKLLLNWTPPPTCPLFLTKNAQCVADGVPHSGEGENFLTGQLIFFTETAVTP